MKNFELAIVSALCTIVLFLMQVNLFGQDYTRDLSSTLLILFGVVKLTYWMNVSNSEGGWIILGSLALSYFLGQLLLYSWVFTWDIIIGWLENRMAESLMKTHAINIIKLAITGALTKYTLKTLGTKEAKRKRYMEPVDLTNCNLIQVLTRHWPKSM